MAVHRMLVVEDHDGTRTAVQVIFTRLGWHVSTARTVAEGLARLDSDPEPCCLLLDLDLPDGGGEAVLARVREKGLRTRVAVATGSMDLPRLRAVADLEPDLLLAKPITTADIWDGLCRVCEAH